MSGYPKAFEKWFKLHEIPFSNFEPWQFIRYKYALLNAWKAGRAHQKKQSVHLRPLKHWGDS